MKTIEGKKKKALAIIIRLLIMVVAVACFYGFRFFLFFAGLVLLVIDLIRVLEPRKFKLMLLALDSAIIILVSTLTFSSRVDLAVENMRFKVLGNQYEATVEELLPTLQDTEDTSWSTYKFKALLPLCSNNELAYRKYGESIAVYFSTFNSFSADSGFIYFSDRTARDFFEHPSEYDQNLSAEPAYDYIEPYNANWAYITLYY